MLTTDASAVSSVCARASALLAPDFLSLRKALTAYGVPVVEAALARSEDEAIALQRRFGGPGRGQGRDIRAFCTRAISAASGLAAPMRRDVAEAYRAVIQNARNAGFRPLHVLIQPMVTGVAEAYAGVIDDPLLGPAICFGLGGMFVEIFNDAKTEMAPLSHDDARAMICGIKGAKILTGARGRKGGDIDALADLLVRLGQFAVANAGRFRALDLNPIIVRAAGEGVVAVDIAVETSQDERSGQSLHMLPRSSCEAANRKDKKMSYQDLLYSVEDKVATITLNRPDRMNALSRNLEAEIHRAFDEADADRNVRAIILTGNGPGFCAGYDQAAAPASGVRHSDPQGKSHAEYHRVLAAPRRHSRQPTGRTCGGSASRSSLRSTAGRWAAVSGTSSPPTSPSPPTRRCSRSPKSATSPIRAICLRRCAAGRRRTAGR